MIFHVGRNGSSLGQFSLEEIREGMITGKFQASDLVWTEGMKDWQNIREALPEVIPTPPGLPIMPKQIGSLTEPQILPPPISMTEGAKLEDNNLATYSLIIGILAFLSCCCPPGSIILAIVGAVLGHLGLSEHKKSNGTKGGKNSSIAGLILSYAALILVAAILIFGENVDSAELQQTIEEKIEELNLEIEESSSSLTDDEI